MAKPQITIRLSPTLLANLDNYVVKTGSSKTQVVVGALAKYLDCVEELPLTYKILELEKKLTNIETEIHQTKSQKD
ncbi:hypothetical protein PCC7424_2418 [Gloeothece citriformis PCC 7424]|uniref:CopG domain protein DNA-binding domain protein n=1 Tax=Gloeothece citriformis (strain PCC 7424) TaxID=65393 RepID=B7KJ03_GLOC7|nr:hypothetical protein [Gloeothece citriformis]ACK70839.1 hypothetical protein PCC7424_2418 [Gloeothece citriformis PCC 7424]